MTSSFWERFYNACINKDTKPNPVAKDIGISSGIVTKWKSAGTLPNGETLIKIADYLECSVDYLLGRTNFPELLVKDNNSNYVPADFGIDDEMLIAADIKKSVFPKEEDETTIL